MPADAYLRVDFGEQGIAKQRSASFLDDSAMENRRTFV